MHVMRLRVCRASMFKLTIKEFPLRIGETSTGLEGRYRGGTGYAIDAAMHNSGNLVFAAEVPEGLSRDIEKELIWREKRTLLYDNQDKSNPPFKRFEIRHQGDPPKFSEQRENYMNNRA